MARWPGPGPGPGPGPAICPAHGLVARWPGPGPGSCPGVGRLVARGPVPVPVLAPARSRWPGPSPNKADHLCSVASFKQSLPGIWWFYAVRAKPLVRGKQYCEVGTIIEQKQEPNGCQSQLLDMKTLDVASLAAVFLERLRSRCCLPGVGFLEPF